MNLFKKKEIEKKPQEEKEENLDKIPLRPFGKNMKFDYKKEEKKEKENSSEEELTEQKPKFNFYSKVGIKSNSPAKIIKPNPSKQKNINEKNEDNRMNISPIKPNFNIKKTPIDLSNEKNDKKEIKTIDKINKKEKEIKKKISSDDDNEDFDVLYSYNNNKKLEYIFFIYYIFKNKLIIIKEFKILFFF